MNIKILSEICKISNFHELANYLEKSYTIRESLINIVDNKELIIFGAGYHGRKLLERLHHRGIFPKFFCDNDKNKWGQCIDGLYVLPPSIIKNNAENTLAIICIISINEPIANQLEEMGIQYLFADIDGTIGENSSPNLCNNIDKLLEVNDLLVDDFSKKVYLNVIKSRIFQNYSFELSGSLFVHEIVSGPQYFDNKFFKYKDNEVFVDCGPYDGDSIIEFFMHVENMNLKSCKAYAFEPDKINYEKVLKNIRKYGLDNVEVFNCGVANVNSKLDMEEIQNCRHVNEHYKIEMNKLDDVIGDEKITFIKMDIEGFELDALKGAEKTIKKYKPKLAISVYHNSSDLYEIPLYLKLIVPEYKFFLRHHSYNTIWETICYAYID